MKTLFELLVEGGTIKICWRASTPKDEYVFLTGESYVNDKSHFSEVHHENWPSAWETLITQYSHWPTMYPGYIDPVFVDFVRESYEYATSQLIENQYLKSEWHTALDYPRKGLVETALNWEATFRVMPAITSAVSEYDATRLIGISGKGVETIFQNQTAVTKGYDFIWNGIKYQVKANRPSGRKGSEVTMISKPKNYDWDNLIWILYDKAFLIREVLMFKQKDFKNEFDSFKIVRPKDLRKSPSAENLLKFHEL